jgi:N-acetylglutamate synthase
MLSWPDLGTRVTVRYRRTEGSVPPLTDVVGHLLAVEPMVRVQTKTGAVVEFAPADVVALRPLTDAPVRTSAIRGLEHAAAAAWPGAEESWLDGWLLRSGHNAANSAVPLDISAQRTAIPAIVAWYQRRDLTPWLLIPDRLLAPPPGATSERGEQVLVRAVGDADVSATTTGRRTRLGESARAAVTEAPDGTRWVGLSGIDAAGDPTGASRECESLLTWGAHCGATRAYLHVGDDDTVTAALAGALGFRLHHRRRYIAARSGDWDSV